MIRKANSKVQRLIYFWLIANCLIIFSINLVFAAPRVANVCFTVFTSSSLRQTKTHFDDVGFQRVSGNVVANNGASFRRVIWMIKRRVNSYNHWITFPLTRLQLSDLIWSNKLSCKMVQRVAQWWMNSVWILKINSISFLLNAQRHRIRRMKLN